MDPNAGHSSEIEDRGKQTLLTAIFLFGVGLVLLPAFTAAHCHAQTVSLSTPLIYTFAGKRTGCLGQTNPVGDGCPAVSATLMLPTAVLLDPSGDLYIADAGEHRVRIVNATSGIITTVAGTGANSFSGDNGPATLAALSFPTGIALDTTGNLYIADKGNQRVRMVNAATGVITTIAGNGKYGYNGDGRSAMSAKLAMPYGVAVETTTGGDHLIYIADEGSQRIRQVDAATGMITTVAGGSGTNGCNTTGMPALSAKLTNPTGVTFSGGNLYIADYGGHCIRELVGANLNTVAGTGNSGYIGDGGPAASAQLSYPTGTFLEPSGNLFIADSFTSVIREVSAAGGTISTQAGLAGYGRSVGDSGDTGPATSAQMNYPYGIAVDGSGDVFIADKQNNVVRETIPQDPETVTFGPSAVGNPVQKNVFLSINGAAISVEVLPSTATVFKIEPGSIFGWQGTQCFVDAETVNPTGTVCVVPITFKPEVVGPNSATLAVTTTYPPMPIRYDFTLVGDGK